MRIWTIHPRYLDRQGLLALWREGLLAQAVLQGKTKGYRNHPQLDRFRQQRNPVAALATYLAAVQHEAARRGYAFDASKIGVGRVRSRIPETRGQLLYEWQHLKKKLARRTPGALAAVAALKTPRPHPLFRVVAGPIREFERVAGR